MIPASRRAIGRLDVLDSSGNRVDWGTAFLAGPRLLLTAYHVVADRGRSDWAPKGARFEITFVRAGARSILVATEPVDADPTLDFAALELLEDAPNDVDPLVVSSTCPEDGLVFGAWGFPRLNPTGGFDVSGRVSDANARLDGRVPALQLYALEAAAPDAAMSGLSGGPCVVDDRAIGLVRSFPTMDDQRVAGGTIYACATYLLVSRPALRARLRLDPCAGLPSLPSDHPWPPTPFLDLLPYTENHARVFFGRCREVARLLQMIADQPGSPILVCGQTGVGKSSLLRAGLLPRAAKGWATEYAARDREAGLTSTLSSLVGSAATSQGPRPRLLVIDQLEEAITRPRQSDPHELRDFAFAVTKHLSVTPRDRIVLAFRKEWLAEFEALFAPHGTGCPILLIEPLSSDAIAEVAMAATRDSELQQRWGLTVDQEAAQEIARLIASDLQSAIAPALQVLLTRLWRQAVAQSRSRPHITTALVKEAAKVGLGLGEVLESRLQGVYAELPETADGLALDVLEFHTTALGTAETRSKKERDDTYGALSVTVETLMLRLHEHFLLVDGRGEDSSAAGATRLSHDALAPLVRARFAASGLRGQRARRVLENRSGEWSGDKSGVPLDAHDLALVESGLSQMRAPSSSQQRMLVASRERQRESAQQEAERERKRRRLELVVRGLLLAALAALAGLGLLTRAVSERNRSLAHAAGRDRLADAQGALRARNVAAAALELAASVEALPPGDSLRSVAIAALVNALPEAPRLVGDVGPAAAATFTESGDALLIRRPDGQVATWALSNPRELPSPSLPTLGEFERINFLDPPLASPGGEFAALVVPVSVGPGAPGPERWRIVAWAVGRSAFLVDEEVQDRPRLRWAPNDELVVHIWHPSPPVGDETRCWRLSSAGAAGIPSASCAGPPPDGATSREEGRRSSVPPFEAVAEGIGGAGDRFAVSPSGHLLLMPVRPLTAGNRGTSRRGRMEVPVEGGALRADWTSRRVRVVDDRGGVASPRCRVDFDGFRGFDTDGRHFWLDRNGVIEIHSTRGPECSTVFSLATQPGNVSRGVLDDWRTREFVGLMFREAQRIGVSNPSEVQFTLTGGAAWRLRAESHGSPRVEFAGHEGALPQGEGNGFLNYQSVSPSGSFLVTCDPYGSVYGPFCWRVWDIRGERPYLIWGAGCLDTAESAPGSFNESETEFAFDAEHSPAAALLSPHRDGEWAWATRAGIAAILGFDVRDGRLVPLVARCEELDRLEAVVRREAAAGDSASRRVLAMIEGIGACTRGD